MNESRPAGNSDSAWPSSWRARAALVMLFGGIALTLAGGFLAFILPGSQWQGAVSAVGMLLVVWSVLLKPRKLWPGRVPAVVESVGIYGIVLLEIACVVGLPFLIGLAVDSKKSDNPVATAVVVWILVAVDSAYIILLPILARKWWRKVRAAPRGDAS